MERHVWHNLVSRTCLNRFDNGEYIRIQFLRAVSHRLGARALCEETEQSDSDDADDADDVPTASGNVAPSAAVQPPDLSEVCLVEKRDACHACTGPLRPSALLCVVCGTGRRGSS